MRQRRFMQCDVFSSDPTLGNGLAVVLDGEGLSTLQMQRFAAWTNLAETTFVLPPDDPKADYRLRIFTVAKEMAFAGHPTLGSCAAWLAAGNRPKNDGYVIQECNIGLVEIDQTGPVPAFVAPPTQIAPMEPSEQARYASALQLDPNDILRAVVLNNGPIWNLLELKDAATVLAVDEACVSWPDYQGLSLFSAYSAGADCAFETRNIAPSSGMSEDPITGSLNAAIARWLLTEGRLQDQIVISQGTKLNRTGRVHISRNDDRVLVGGHSSILIDGTLTL